MRSLRLALFVVFVLAGTSVFAQHAAKGKPKSDGGATTQEATATDKLRQPTKEEAAELTAGLERALSQPTEGLREIQLDNGIVGLDLDGTHENVALAKRNPDGTITVGCVNTMDEASDFLTNNNAQAQAKPEKKAATSAPQPAQKLEEK